MTKVQYSAKRVFITLLFNQQQARLSHFLGDNLSLNLRILRYCLGLICSPFLSIKTHFLRKWRRYSLYNPMLFFSSVYYTSPMAYGIMQIISWFYSRYLFYESGAGWSKPLNLLGRTFTRKKCNPSSWTIGCHPTSNE